MVNWWPQQPEAKKESVEDLRLACTAPELNILSWAEDNMGVSVPDSMTNRFDEDSSFHERWKKDLQLACATLHELLPHTSTAHSRTRALMPDFSSDAPPPVMTHALPEYDDFDETEVLFRAKAKTNSPEIMVMILVVPTNTAWARLRAHGCGLNLRVGWMQRGVGVGRGAMQQRNRTSQLAAWTHVYPDLPQVWIQSVVGARVGHRSNHVGQHCAGWRLRLSELQPLRS